MKVKREIAYISGPMTGHPEHNYPAFMVAEEKWKEKYMIINPAKTCVNPGVDEREHLLAMDLVNVIRSDVIIMLNNYGSSEGAMTELIVAQQTGSIVIMSDTGEEIQGSILTKLLNAAVLAAIHTPGAIGEEISLKGVE